MSYTALYRKFRPSGFEDVKGQDHIVTTLKNQIKANRIGHAYLFCGTRGTGKTSIAKIFAKAVNCQHPIDGSPCMECETCKGITNQTSMNVIEIDAASNNGVDNIRQISEEVLYSPTEGKYKVYIIDEVHMLSTGAFNAFLKTLEEPPSYVIFILATTEVHKIPITILSRCQRYDFRRITIDTVSDRLMDLMDRESTKVEEKAIRYIAKVADGSMRDALSLLDQCIAFYLGQELTYDNVLEVLGAVDTEVFEKLLKAVINEEVTNCIYQLEDLIIAGRELGQFVVDFTWYLRNLLLIKTSDNPDEALDMSLENITSLRQISSLIQLETLMRYIRIFSELSNQVKYSTQKRVLIELALIKLCKPAMEINYDSIINRLNVIESQLEKGIKIQPIENKMSTESKPEPKDTPKQIITAVPEDIKEIVRNWNNIASKSSGSIKSMLNDLTLSIGGDNKLLLVFNEELDKAYIDREEVKKDLESLISKEIGKEVVVQTKLVKNGQNNEEIIDLKKIIKMDIEYID